MAIKFYRLDKAYLKLFLPTDNKTLKQHQFKTLGFVGTDIITQSNSKPSGFSPSGRISAGWHKASVFFETSEEEGQLHGSS